MSGATDAEVAKVAAGTCETCEHWRFDTPDWQFDALRIGECKAIRMREEIESEATQSLVDGRWDDAAEPLICEAIKQAKAIAVDGSGYYAALRTLPDFGCVLHTVRNHLQQETPDA